MTIDLICDIEDSFMHEYLPGFIASLRKKGLHVRFYKKYKGLKRGDIAFFISCKTFISSSYRALHGYNVVIHPSKLPLWPGSGVVAWQILGGINKICVTLFEAEDKIDGGKIYYQGCVKISKKELCKEIRHKQANLTFRLIEQFLKDYPDIKFFTQKSSNAKLCPKRSPADSELDVNKTIKEQFNLLRVVDNKRYPAFFTIYGRKYTLTINGK